MVSRPHPRPLFQPMGSTDLDLRAGQILRLHGQNPHRPRRHHQERPNRARQRQSHHGPIRASRPRPCHQNRLAPHRPRLRRRLHGKHQLRTTVSSPRSPPRIAWNSTFRRSTTLSPTSPSLFTSGRRPSPIRPDQGPRITPRTARPTPTRSEWSPNWLSRFPPPPATPRSCRRRAFSPV